MEKHDKKYDDQLLIRTRGIREWKGNVPYNRCESTPYVALDKLFETYTFKETDQVVDFGAGRGRVAFYIHHKFDVPVTAIELNETTLDEAIENQQRYLSQAKEDAAPIMFQYGYAEDYEIQEKDNKFYFFNPFKAKIFTQVVDNIVQSAKTDNKVVDIILYYPMPSFRKYLEDRTDFELVNRVSIKGVQDKREHFLIYRLDPLKEDDNA